MPTDVDDWYRTDPAEYMPDHRCTCHACGEKIDDYEVYEYYADYYHRECLEEIFREEAEKEIEQMLRDAHTPRY